jgi:heat shock protein HslJ
MRSLALAAVIGLVVAACSVSSSEVDDGQVSGSGLPPNTDQASLTLFGPDVYGSWQLTSGSVDGQPIPIVDSHPITLSIGLDAVGGTAACNSYFYAGSLPVGEGFGFGVTEMACSPLEVMESEAAYLSALARVEMGAAEDGLLLVGQGGEVELHFKVLEPVPTADLLKTVWALDGLIQGDTVTSVSGERATLELFSDGSFIGSTGCRDISGSYIVTGAEVQFTNWRAFGECPSELATQDSRVISALEGGFRVEIEEDQMTTWVAGDEGLIYRADN